MNKWIILGIVCLLVVSSVVFAAVSNKTTETSQTAVKTGCGSCNGGCTSEKNCGSASCGATTGETCTCGKTTSCGACNGGCTADSNCGLASCGATSGGKCGCGAA